MKTISKVAAGVRPSATVVIDDKAKSMKAAGLDVIGFGAGEPDFDTPEHIKEAGIQAIRENKTRYTTASGILPLRQAIVDRIREDCQLEYDPEEIVVTSGAKHNVFLALSVIVDPGDEVIVPIPYWPSFGQMVPMVGGVPVFLKTTEEHHFKICPEELESIITEKTKAIIINNPSNPTGMVYSREELRAIADICVKHDLYIIADEVYYKLVYDGRKFVSMAALGEEVKERTIVISGASKGYAMTGWRMGYSASNPVLAKAMKSFVSNSTGSPSTICQYAYMEALNGPQECTQQMIAEYESRRDYMYERMQKIPGITCHKPEGAFYIMMGMESYIGKKLGGRMIRNSVDFAEALLEKAMVAVVPAADFGTPNHLRFVYATSMENIKEGLDRLEKFIRTAE